MFPAGGVDASGQGGGTSDSSFKFDITVLTETIHSSMFARYADLILTLEDVTLSFATWAEDCPCHGRLLQHCRAEKQARSLVGHGSAVGRYHVFKAYGAGHARCPMQGKRAPELAADGLLDVFGQVWSLHASLFLSAPSGSMPLSPADLRVISEDLEAGKVHMQLLLQAKLDYWSRLPWHLCTLAHKSEPTARDHARLCVQMFERDPREAAHHRITWLWLAPSSPLRYQVDLFIAGAERLSLDSSFTRKVAELRFVPLVESVIEQRHAKVQPGLHGARTL